MVFSHIFGNSDPETRKSPKKIQFFFGNPRGF